MREFQYGAQAHGVFASKRGPRGGLSRLRATVPAAETSDVEASRFAEASGGPRPPLFPDREASYKALALYQVDGRLHHIIGCRDGFGIGLVSALGLDELCERRGDVHVGSFERTPF